MKKLFLLIISILLSVTAKADYEDDFTVWIGGILYSLYEQQSEGIYEAVVINPVENNSNPPVNYEGDIVIPSQFLYDGHYYTVIGIGECAFVYNQKPGGGNTSVSPLTSIALPNTVKNIGKEAFSGCNSLTSIVIPNNVATIEESAFAGCTGLTNVVIPNSVLTIGEKAFYGCTGLASATLSSKVSDIGDKAFYGCNNLATVTARGIRPAHITSDVFPNRLSQTLYVPKGRKSLYEDADYWWQFENIIDKGVVTVNNKNRPYGDENPDFDVSIEGGELQGEMNISCEATKESPVGQYDVTATLSGADEQDFIVINGALYVEKAPLVISAGDYTMPANESLPKFEPIYEGFKNGEDESVLTQKPEIFFMGYSGEEFIPDEEGDWREPGAIYTLSVRGAEARNYNIGYVDGYLHITDRVSHLVVAELQDVTRLYGEENPTFEYTIVEGSEYFDENYIHFYCEAEIDSPVGTYEIIMNKDPSIPGRYVPFDFEPCIGTLTIKPTPLKVIAEDHERNQYEENPEFTIRYEGFKLEEDEDVLDVKPVATTTATPDCEPGEYEITVSGGEAENYEFVYQNGKLTILSVQAIDFADTKVKALCVANWDTNHDGELSMTEAAAVADLGDVFKENSEITSFDELHYFTGLTSIGTDAFYDCSSLTSVIIPNSVTSIGLRTFYGCSSLTSIDIPYNVMSINNGAFAYCSGLTSIIIPNNVTNIGGLAFGFCSNLTSVSIPNSVTSIGDWAFYNCSNLTSVTVEWENPLDVSSHMPFYETSVGQATLYVPAGTMAAYQTASVWKDFGNIVVNTTITFADATVKSLCVDNWDTNHDGELSIAEAAAVTDLGDVFKENSEIASFDELQYFTGLTSLAGTFERCTGLTSIVIPSAVESINSWSDMDALERVQVDEQNPWFDSRNGCNAVIETATNTLVVGCKTTVIPNDVIAIGDNAFGGRWGMEAMYIPSSVTTIGIHAFSYCINMKQISLPASVTSIGEEAFIACTSLNSVTVEWENPLVVPENIFRLVPVTKVVLHVPEGTKAAYKAADVWKEFFMDGDDWDTWVAELLLRELITRLESAGGYELDEAKATADNYNATKEELDGCIAQLQLQIKDRCANADESELPVDATGLINNPSFTFDTNSYWLGDTPQFQSFNDAEFFQTTFDIHQQLTGLPNGRYLLKVKGFHRPGSNEDVFNDYQQGIDNASAQLYANEESVTFNNQAAFAQNEWVEGTGFEVGGTHQYVPNTMYDAYIWFRNGYYENELPVTVIDGTMNLGIRLDESVNGGWVIFDDFRLEYLGKDPNRLYADEAAAPLKMYRYKTANLDLHLDNEETLIAFEFNLRLPEGVSIALDEDGYPDAVLNEARSDRHNLEVEERSDGSYHFLCYSNSNNAFKGNNGELLSIKLVCDEDIEPGAYQGLLSSIKFVDADENSLLMPELSFDIEVVDITMGDVNDDGDIDVLDVVAMVNYIMEKPSANFIFAAADHNEDGLVDVVDLVKEVRLVMSQAANAPSTSFDQLGGGLSLVAGQDGAVTLNIDDAASYVASQFLVTLSHGQRLADVTTDKRHTVSFEPVSDNQYVVVSYSNTNACYASNTAALTLHVEGGGQVDVEGATFVSDNKERVSFQNVNSEHTDGIRYASYDFARPADIYSTSGALLKKNATSADGLKAGVYVVNGNKYLKK